MMTIFIFLFGLIIGSFVACMIDRVRSGWTMSDVLMKPSRCLSCDTPLKPWQNIPVVSYVVQKGKCPSCGARIPRHLPLYELVVALGAVVLYHLILWVFNVA